MMTAVIESDTSALHRPMRSDWFYSTCHFVTDNLLKSADKDQQEMRVVAEKPHDMPL